MTYLFENNTLILSESKPFFVSNLKADVSKMAFCYHPFSLDKEAEELLLLQKIVSAVDQKMEETLLINLDQCNISIPYLKNLGVDFLICFSNYQLKQWQSIQYQMGKAFRMSDIVVFPAAALTTLGESQEMKNKLWKFLKDRKE